MARRDPATFIRFCFRDPAGRPLAPGPIHTELQAFLTAHSRALVELPRDHGKTVQVCGRVVWELGHAPGLRVAVVCATSDIAAARSRFLRDAIAKNPRVGLVFPTLQPATPWDVASFTIARPADTVGPSVRAFGIGAAATGTRADLLICDDVTDARALVSRAERDRVQAVFTNTLMNLLDPAGRCWSLSTPWHPDDLSARLKRNPAYTLFRRAIGPALEPVWPERWPTEALLARRAEIGRAAFARGYHLQPVAEGESLIRPGSVPVGVPSPRGDYGRVVVSVDPAVSVRPGADPTALVVLGQPPDTTRIDCLSATARRVAAPDLVAWLADTARAWQPDAILFESNAAFLGLCDLLKRHPQFGSRIVGITQSRSKDARLAALAVTIEAGGFHVAADQTELLNELTGYPFAPHDDLADAAATGVAWLQSHRDTRVW